MTPSQSTDRVWQAPRPPRVQKRVEKAPLEPAAPEPPVTRGEVLQGALLQLLLAFRDGDSPEVNQLWREVGQRMERLRLFEKLRTI